MKLAMLVVSIASMLICFATMLTSIIIITNLRQRIDTQDKKIKVLCDALVTEYSQNDFKPEVMQ